MISFQLKSDLVILNSMELRKHSMELRKHFQISEIRKWKLKFKEKWGRTASIFKIPIEFYMYNKHIFTFAGMLWSLNIAAFSPTSSFCVL